MGPHSSPAPNDESWLGALLMTAAKPLRGAFILVLTVVVGNGRGCSPRPHILILLRAILRGTPKERYNVYLKPLSCASASWGLDIGIAAPSRSCIVSDHHDDIQRRAGGHLFANFGEVHLKRNTSSDVPLGFIAGADLAGVRSARPHAIEALLPQRFCVCTATS